MAVLYIQLLSGVISVNTCESGMTSGFSSDDDLYQEFGKGFVQALHDGIQITKGNKSGCSARELVDELKAYVEGERVREHR